MTISPYFSEFYLPAESGRYQIRDLSQFTRPCQIKYGPGNRKDYRIYYPGFISAYIREKVCICLLQIPAFLHCRHIVSRHTLRPVLLSLSQAFFSSSSDN
jgi:hypothetical protein